MNKMNHQILCILLEYIYIRMLIHVFGKFCFLYGRSWDMLTQKVRILGSTYFFNADDGKGTECSTVTFFFDKLAAVVLSCTLLTILSSFVNSISRAALQHYQNAHQSVVYNWVFHIYTAAVFGTSTCMSEISVSHSRICLVLASHVPCNVP